MAEFKINVPENFSVEEADEFRQEINGIFDVGENQFLFDFSRCVFIDSTGLGVLVGIHKKCAKLGGSLKLKSISSQVMRVFELTRLDKVFDIQV